MKRPVIHTQIFQLWYILEESTKEGAVEDSDVIIPVSHRACQIK